MSFNTRLSVQAKLCAAQVKKALIKSFDKLRTNGGIGTPFVVSLSNHEPPFVVSRPKP